MSNFVDVTIPAQTADDDPMPAVVGVAASAGEFDGVLLQVTEPGSGSYIAVELDLDGAQQAIDALTASIDHLTNG